MLTVENVLLYHMHYARINQLIRNVHETELTKQLAEETSGLGYLKRYWQYIAMIVLALILFFLAYKPVLFNFFIADDFQHLAGLRKALLNPELFAKSYWTPWIFPPLTWDPANSMAFYRPLFYTIMFLECKLWGFNGFYPRVLNIFIELMSGFMIGLIVMGLQTKSSDNSRILPQCVLIWSLSSAVLFILFPLHGVTVSWMATGMDLLVTLFSLISIWCYMQWRQRSSMWCFMLSITAAVLAFLTKEMAATLPAIIFIYELIFQELPAKNPDNKGLKVINLKSCYRAGINSLPYWLICIIYFCLRKAILGDFIAGYPDIMCSPLSFSGWLQGLYTIFVPINSFIVEDHRFIFRAWHILLFISLLLTGICVTKADQNNRKVFCFLVIWFLLCLAPAYKVFPTFMTYPCGQRVAYLATAPFCIFLTFGLSVFCASVRFGRLFKLIMLAFLGVAAATLYANNLAFAEAGHLSNKVVDALRQYYKDKSGDPLICITELPRLCKGIYYLPVGGLNQLTQKPIMNRDLSNCTYLGTDDQNISMGFLKNEFFADDHAKVNLLYWDLQSGSLKSSKVCAHQNLVRQWRGARLKEIVRTPSFRKISELDAHWLDKETLELIPKRGTQFAILELDLRGMPCWAIDFLALKLSFVQLSDFGSFGGAAFFFTNDIAKRYSKEYFGEYFADCCRATIKPVNFEQEIVFPLRNLPAWTMGGKCNSVRIVLPANCKIRIKELSMPEARNLMPLVSLPPTIDELPGELRLDKEHVCQLIKYDAHSIKGCKQVVLEVAYPTKPLDGLSLRSNKNPLFYKKRFLDLNGIIQLNRSYFPSEKASYRAKLRALDAAGNQVGFAGDPFFIVVDS